MKATYVIFKSEEQFKERVKMAIKIWSTELGIVIDKNIPIRISNRMTSGLGKFVYSFKRDKVNKTITYTEKELVFSSQLLDGRYLIDEVDDVVLHELAHYFVFKQGNYEEGHGQTFKNMCAKIGCNASSCARLEKSEVYDNIVLVKTKYIVKCKKCGNTTEYTKATKVVNCPSLYRCKCNGTLEVIKH